MICANTIGMRGVCNANSAKYFTDSFGITLHHASKLAHSSNQTGKELFESKLELAWQLVQDDILVNGFEFNRVIWSFDNKFTSEFSTITEATLTNPYINTGLYINYFKFKVIGSGNFKVTLNDVEIFANEVDNETIKVSLDNFIDDTLVINLIYDGTIQVQDANGYPFEISGYYKCDKSRFLCKYADILCLAVVYKVCALMLNEYLLSPNFDDFRAYANENQELAIKLSQLDSSLAIIPIEEAPIKVGNYQKELMKISKILKDEIPICDTCFKCTGKTFFEYVNL